MRRIYNHAPILFPAHAGVILNPLKESISRLAIPRTRGGDPQSTAPEKIETSYSPHTRG